MSDTVILNVATDGYVKWQNRLRESLDKFAPAFDRKYWVNELPEGSRSHADSPYGFKIHAIKWAMAQGYRYIFWIDSGLYAIRRMEPVFDALVTYGMYLVRDENKVAKYCSQEALDWFGKTREQMSFVHLVSGALVGMDTENPVAKEVWRRWLIAYDAGLYKGTVSKHSGQEDHRGDESILGMIAADLGLKLHTVRDHFCADGQVIESSIFRSGYYD